MEIQKTGFELLSDDENKDLEKLFSRHFQKIEKKLKNISSFHVHLKEYKKESNRKKFSIHLRIEAPTRRIFEADASGFDFKIVLHKLFKKINEELEHRFHLSNQHSKNKSN